MSWSGPPPLPSLTPLGDLWLPERSSGDHLELLPVRPLRRPVRL
jgi:hypothetical protein